MYKVTSRGTEKGRDSNYDPQEVTETVEDIFAEAAGFASETLSNQGGRWINDTAPHLRQRLLRG